MDPELLLFPYFDLSNNGPTTWYCSNPECGYSLIIRGDSTTFPGEHEHQLARLFDFSGQALLNARLSTSTRREDIAKLLRTMVGSPLDNQFARKVVAVAGAHALREGVFYTPSEKPSAKKNPPVYHRYRECAIPRSTRYKVLTSTDPAIVPDCPDCAHLSPKEFALNALIIFSGTMLIFWGKNDKIPEDWLSIQRRFNLGPDRNLTAAHLFRQYRMRVNQRYHSDTRLVEDGKRNNRGPKEAPLPFDFFDVLNRERARLNLPLINLTDVCSAGDKMALMKMYHRLSSK